MRIKLNGTILESNNALVTDQWKKKGYKEFKGKAPEPLDGKTGGEPEQPDGDPEKK